MNLTHQRKNSLTILFIFMSLFFSQLNAHDFRLSASNYQPNLGDSVGIYAHVGSKFVHNPLPRIDDWFSRFEVYDNNIATPIGGITGDDPMGTLDIHHNRAQLIIYRSKTNFVELKSKKFNHYLDNEGMSYIKSLRVQYNEENIPSRELYSRCAKLLINPKNSTDISQIYQPTGMVLDLIPMSNPYTLTATTPLTFKLLYQGKPLNNMQVSAYNQSNPEVRYESITNEEGMVELFLPTKGVWLVKSTYMVRKTEKNPDNAVWESFWASIVFDNGE